MNKIVKYLNKNLEVKENFLAELESEDELLKRLTIYIQELIDTDFQYFLWTLYKIDVNEKKVKETIKKDPQNASEIIAKLIIERVKEKIKTREEYRDKDDNSKEDDWIFL